MTPILADAVLSPLVVAVLCAVAGIGTVLLMPSRREAAFRRLGGIILLASLAIFAAMLIRVSFGSVTEKTEGVRPYFWFFSAVALIGAIRVVTHQRPVYSALYFVLTVLASAGLFILLSAEFMAAALVLIYAGAILVTYVFVIMLAAQTSSDRPLDKLAEYDLVAREPVATTALGFVLMAVLLFVIFDLATPIAPMSGEATNVVQVGANSSSEKIGNMLFGSQLLNVELAGFILTIAMVGATAIARRKIVSQGVSVTAESPVGPTGESDPKEIPVYGTENPHQKEFPQH